MSDNTQELRKKLPLETRIGMLRQWINEDRIINNPNQTLVTNEDIIRWLELDDIKSQTNQAVLEARIDAYADCASKGGTGTTVRIYAESRANGLKATLRQELTQEVQTDE